jgi:hypothetical protein
MFWLHWSPELPSLFSSIHHVFVQDDCLEPADSTEMRCWRMRDSASGSTNRDTFLPALIVIALATVSVMDAWTVESSPLTKVFVFFWYSFRFDLVQGTSRFALPPSGIGDGLRRT